MSINLFIELLGLKANPNPTSTSISGPPPVLNFRCTTTRWVGVVTPSRPTSLEGGADFSDAQVNSFDTSVTGSNTEGDPARREGEREGDPLPPPPPPPCWKPIGRPIPGPSELARMLKANR